MNNTKTCTACGDVKPSTPEFFYRRTGMNDGLHSKCKECIKKYANKRYKSNKTTFGRRSEQLLIEYLLKNGIYADVGRNHSLYRWADVVAWGCVVIELKSSTYHQHGGYRFSFTKHQQERGLTADVVCLHCADDNTFHFFAPTTPEFYNGDKLKTGIGFTIHSSKRANNSMSESLMLFAKDNLSLIELSRIAKTTLALEEIKAA